jgi:RHS repeat-associated protein
VILRDHDDGTPVPRSWGPRIATILNDEQLVDDLNPTGYPQVVEELSGAGVVAHQYTYGLQRISENQVLNGAWTPSFYGYDGGGNVRQLTNSAGTVTDEYEYDAFGNSFTKVGTTPNNYLYRGEQYDPDLGLYYLRARYYNPATGRFLSRDPLDGHTKDPASLHKYLYANGDPVNGMDPRGRDDLVDYLRGIRKVLASPFAYHAAGILGAACTALFIAQDIGANVFEDELDKATGAALCAGVGVFAFAAYLAAVP